MLSLLLLPAITQAKDGEMLGRLRYYAAAKKENSLLESGLYGLLKYSPDTTNDYTISSSTLENMIAKHPKLQKPLMVLQGMKTLKEIKAQNGGVGSMIHGKVREIIEQKKEDIKNKIEERKQKRQERKSGEDEDEYSS